MILCNDTFPKLFNYKEIKMLYKCCLKNLTQVATSTGEETIPPKLVKLASKFDDCNKYQPSCFSW